MESLDYQHKVSALQEAKAQLIIDRQYADAHGDVFLLKMINNTLDIVDDALHPDSEKEYCEKCKRKVWIGKMRHLHGELICETCCFEDEAHRINDILGG